MMRYLLVFALLLAFPAQAFEAIPMECFKTAIELDRLESINAMYAGFNRPVEAANNRQEFLSLYNSSDFVELCVNPRLCDRSGGTIQDYQEAKMVAQNFRFLFDSAKICGPN